MVKEPLKSYIWSPAEHLKIKEFFFLVTGIDPKPVFNKRKTRLLFTTDMLRPIERQVLELGNYKSLQILEGFPPNWQTHPESDIIGCVDFAEHLPEPIKHRNRVIRVDKQHKKLQFKDRIGLYKSDGLAWKRVGRLPKGRHK